MPDFTFTGMPNAPGAASFVAPQVNFAPLGELANDYTRGVENKQKIDVAQAFRNGIPKDSGGNPDYSAMAEKLYRIGDLGGANTLQQTGIQMGQMRNAAALTPMIGPQGATAPPAATGSPIPGPPMPADGATPPAPPAAAPAGRYAGGDAGTGTVASIVGGALPAELAGPAINEIAARVKADPNQPLTPMQQSAVRALVARTTGGGAPPAGPGATPPLGAPGPTTLAQVNPAGDPIWQQGGPGGGPAAAVAAPAAQAGGPASPEARVVAGAQSRLDAMPPGEKRAWLNTIATHPGLPDYLHKFAEARLAEMAKAEEPTPAMKEARDPTTLGRVRETKVMESDITSGQKKYDSLDKIGTEAEAVKPQLALSRTLMNSPGFNAGIGSTTFGDAITRVGEALGLGNSASPGQVYDKIRSTAILDQIKAMAGTGPVRVQEMKFIDQMFATREMSPTTLRTLAEIQERLGDRAVDIRNMAQDYRQRYGYLDARFDKQVRQYAASHDLFSKEEINDPRRLGAPTAPPAKTPQQVQAWVAQMGIQPGDPVKMPDGSIQYWHGPKR